MSGTTKGGTPVPGIPLSVALMTALAWGSLAAFGQVAKTFYTFYIRGEFAWTSRDILWMAPLANWLYFGVVASLLWGVSVAWRKRASEPLIAGAMAGLCAFAVILPFGMVQEHAVVLLSAGLGVQYGRMVRHRLPRQRRWVIGAGATAAAVLLFGGSIERATRARRTGAAALAAPAADAPNVLIIIWDTVRASNLSLYGYGRATTPELGRLAETAATFDWAIAPAPWTLPSHCSMFTGLQPGEHRCGREQPLDEGPVTLAEVFGRRGYRTGAFVANRFFTSHETGLARGFSEYSDFQVSLRQLLYSSSLAQMAIPRALVNGQYLAQRIRPILKLQVRGGPQPPVHRKVATTVTDDFLAWQSEHKAPFFAFLNYFDAHGPYRPPAPWRTRFDKNPNNVARYDGAIAYMDAELGRLTRALADQGLLDRTIIVLTSDHGELFGEHGLQAHGNALYTPLTHIPLLVRYPPKLPAGLRVSRPVSLKDLARSVVDLAGLPDSMPGTSFVQEAWWSAAAPSTPPELTRVVLSETERTTTFWSDGPASHGPLHGLVDDNYHYILNPRGKEELFAYRTDTAEANNLVNTAEGAALAARYRALLPATTRRLLP